MIRFTTGDILTADVEALVNTVNCVGIMGRGIALQFKNAFPANFKAYAAACERHEVQPGRMFVFDTGPLARPRYVINFPTKRHWRGKSHIEDIRSGLVALVAEIQRLGIRSVAIPPLGSGLGGLEWSHVRPLVEAASSAVPEVDVLVFEPLRQPEPARTNPSTPVPKMTPGRAALVALMQRYLAGLMDPFVTLLEVHKLLYFLQVAGQPLRLVYVKGIYGPYAENLRHVLRAVEGHLITGYDDNQGDAPGKQLALVPGATDDADAFLRADGETLARIERVTRLVEGFETPFGLELLATVHWLTTNEGTDDRNLVDAVHAWGPQKRQFSPGQIRLVAEHLRAGHWQ